MSELVHVCRRLIRQPRVPLLAAATLALAIGGSGALLSLFDALLMRELRVPRSEELVAVYPGLGEALFGIPLPTLVELRQRQQLVTDLCGYARGALDVEARGATASYRNEGFTGGCHRMLGVRPFRGRLIDERDAPVFGEPAPVVVISHRFWRDSLGGEPSAIGETLRANGVELTVVGITPPSFNGLDADQAPDLTVSLGMMARLLGRRSDSVFALYAIGRLRPETTLAQTRAQLRELWPTVWASTNPPQPGGSTSPAAAATALRVESISRGLSAQRELYGRALYFLLVLSGILTVLAFLNVSGLLLARTAARESEFTLRAALGGSRRQVCVPVVVEGLVIGLAAAVAAGPIAWWTSRVLAATMWTRSTPTSMDVTPGTGVLAAIAAIGLIAGIVVSAPALMAVALRSRHTRPTGTYSVVAVSVHWWRRLLVVGQVAVSVILVFCASLFARHLGSIRSLDPGYESNGLRWTRLELAYGQPRTIDQVAYFRPVLDRIDALPGVVGTALSLGFPTTELRHVTALLPFRRADSVGDSAEASGTLEYVSPAFFGTLGVRLLEGREFAWSDTEGQEPVAIVNRLLAARLFPVGDAIGGRVQYATANTVVNLLVVGVVDNFSPGDVRIRDLPIIYLPLVQNPGLMSAPTLVLRTTNVMGLAEGIRDAVESMRRHRVAGLQTITQQSARFQMRERVLTGLATAFAGLSLLVSSIGLYGLLFQWITTRVREIGVRLALGAQRSSVVASVVREGLLLVFAGLAVGLPFSLAAEQAAQGLFSGLAARDSVSLVVSFLLILLVGLAASWWPAFRASRVEPAEALRQL